VTTKKDYIAFVPLNIFEVLYEKIILSAAIEEWFDTRISPASLLELILDSRLLPYVESAYGE
jgi:hypothetical protein